KTFCWYFADDEYLSTVATLRPSIYTSLIPDADVFLDTHDTAGPVNVKDTATDAPYAVALLPPESNDDEPVDQFDPSYTIADASFSHTPAPTGSGVGCASGTPTMNASSVNPVPEAAAFF
ncbi:hypothetical protein P2P98_00005, partial [Microbacterium sp. Kw_RZR3]|uniref:hypothetical protein n=1 Tax=Microbacterium sp. Kw_RZR3 TaxID=3032903 RepID=UPI0023DC4099